MSEVIIYWFIKAIITACKLVLSGVYMRTGSNCLSLQTWCMIWTFLVQICLKFWLVLDLTFELL